MAIEILSRGTPPEQIPITANCRKCHSTLRWLPGDAKRNWPGDQREGAHSEIDCPVCGGTVYGYPEKSR